MKKLIALILTVAMLVSCFAFSASAAATPVLKIEGPANAGVNQRIVVKVVLDDADKVVGGIEGAITVEGATVTSVAVNPTLKAWNNTDEDATIYAVVGNKVNFAAVKSLDADTYDRSVWFNIYCTVKSATGVTFDVTAEAADKDAKELAITCTDFTVAPASVDASQPTVTLNKSGILAEDTTNATVANQGILINATITIPEGVEVDEFGVLFKPTTLLNGAALEYNTAGALKASVSKEDATFNSYVKAGTFDAILKFGFTDTDRALQFLGTNVTARVYYKIGENVFYSTNSVDYYIQNGVSVKAALNAVINYGNMMSNGQFGEDVEGVTVAQFREALNGLAMSNANWNTNRANALKFAVLNAVKLYHSDKI